MLDWPQRLPSIPATTVRPTLLHAFPFHAWLASTPAIYTSNQQFVVHTSICIRCICQAVTSMQSSMPTSVLSRNRVEGKEPTCSPLTITHSHAHYQLPPCTHQSKSCTLSAPTTFSSHHALTKKLSTPTMRVTRLFPCRFSTLTFIEGREPFFTTVSSPRLIRHCRVQPTCARFIAVR